MMKIKKRKFVAKNTQAFDPVWEGGSGRQKKHIENENKSEFTLHASCAYRGVIVATISDIHIHNDKHAC